MRRGLWLEIGGAAIISWLFGRILLSGSSFRNAVAFLLVLVLSQVFIQHTFTFLLGLLLLRPSLDQFLMSVRISAGGLDIGLGGIVALGLTVATVLYALASPSRSTRLRQGLVYAYAVFFLVNVGAFCFAPDKAEAAKVLLRYSSVLSILTLTVLLVDTEERAHRLAAAMAWSTVLPLAIGLLAWVKDGGRLAATFSHPNILAFYLLIMIGAVLFRLDRPGSFMRLSAKRIAALLLLVGALVLTQTRSGWGAFLVLGGVYVVRYNRRLLAPAVVLVVLLAMTPFVQEKLLNVVDVYGSSVAVNRDSSLGWRIDTWRDLVGQAAGRPIFGHGIGADFRMVKEGLAAHNDYLRFFIESGVVGVLAYFGPYFYLLGRCWREERQLAPDTLARKLAGFFVCFLPAFLLMSITENLASYVAIHWYLWALIGIYLGLQRPQWQEAMAMRAVPCPV